MFMFFVRDNARQGVQLSVMNGRREAENGCFCQVHLFLITGHFEDALTMVTS